MTLQQIAEWLQKQQINKISSITGLSKPTLYSLRDGLHKNPTIETIQKIEMAMAASQEEKTNETI